MANLTVGINDLMNIEKLQYHAKLKNVRGKRKKKFSLRRPKKVKK